MDTMFAHCSDGRTGGKIIAACSTVSRQTVACLCGEDGAVVEWEKRTWVSLYNVGSLLE